MTGESFLYDVGDCVQVIPYGDADGIVMSHKRIRIGRGIYMALYYVKLNGTDQAFPFESHELCGRIRSYRAKH